MQGLWERHARQVVRKLVSGERRVVQLEAFRVRTKPVATARDRRLLHGIRGLTWIAHSDETKKPAASYKCLYRGHLREGRRLWCQKQRVRNSLLCFRSASNKLRWISRGGHIVTDAGLLAIAQLVEGLGILDDLAERWPDPRCPEMVTPSGKELLLSACRAAPAKPQRDFGVILFCVHDAAAFDLLLRKAPIMKRSLVLVLLLAATPSAAEIQRPPVRPFESNAELRPSSKLDELVFAKLKERGIEPARLCSDAVFVRRVYLDVIGTLPTAQEARDFILDETPNKRAALIDRLFERDEFADYWAMKWADVLRVKSEFPINLWPNAVQAYHRWIRTAIRENMPYDRFARELLTASGSNFRAPPVNFYRAVQSREPEAIARAVAVTFMGVRAERWPQDRLGAMAAFFSHIRYKQSGE